MKLHLGVLPLIPSGSISQIHRSVQTLFSPHPCIMVGRMPLRRPQRVHPRYPHFSGDDGKFLQSIKMKGSCPKDLTVGAGVSTPRLREATGTENHPGTEDRGIRAFMSRPPFRQECDVSTYINMKNSSRDAPCSCARRMQFMSRRAFSRRSRRLR